MFGKWKLSSTSAKLTRESARTFWDSNNNKLSFMMKPRTPNKIHTRSRQTPLARINITTVWLPKHLLPCNLHAVGQRSPRSDRNTRSPRVNRLALPVSLIVKKFSDTVKKLELRSSGPPSCERRLPSPVLSRSGDVTWAI